MLPLAVRTHEEMKDVLMDPSAVGPQNHYYMIRGGKDKTNITIWETGNIGGEFIKTYGHYHVGNIGETYWIITGEGIVLLQKRKICKNKIDHKISPIDEEIETFIAIKVKAGDSIYMPSEIGHLVVNTGNKWLVTTDNSPLRPIDDARFPSHANYESIKRMHGFAYYVINDNGNPKLIKNINYKVIPDVQWLTVDEYFQTMMK